MENKDLQRHKQLSYSASDHWVSKEPVHKESGNSEKGVVGESGGSHTHIQ